MALTVTSVGRGRGIPSGVPPGFVTHPTPPPGHVMMGWQIGIRAQQLGQPGVKGQRSHRSLVLRYEFKGIFLKKQMEVYSILKCTRSKNNNSYLGPCNDV